MLPDPSTRLPDWTEPRLAALRLASCWQLSSSTLIRLSTNFPRLGSAGQMLPTQDELQLTDIQHAALRGAQETNIDTLASSLTTSRTQFVLATDPEFPAGLRKQPDPPYAVFIRGAVPRDAMHIAVVGTRRMTDYGKRVTDVLVNELTRHGVTIVSGLALGIDAAAHAACLDAGGTTIAVLPGGVDELSIVPRKHLRLAQRIIDHQGCLLSEHAPGTPVHPYHFLHRNRLIAALADAVVVVEADRDSGALVTAKLALESGREVLAVPGSLWSAGSRGTNELIKNGARPCTSAEDVFAALGLKNPQHAKQISEARASIPVSGDEQRLLDAFGEPRTVDDVARIVGQPIAATNALVSMLELKGRLMSVGPRVFVKV